MFDNDIIVVDVVVRLLSMESQVNASVYKIWLMTKVGASTMLKYSDNMKKTSSFRMHQVSNRIA